MLDGAAVELALHMWQEYITATSPEMAVGEFWTDCNYDGAGALVYDQDSHRQAIVDWCDAAGGTSTAFDFTTKARRWPRYPSGPSILCEAPLSFGADATRSPNAACPAAPTQSVRDLVALTMAYCSLTGSC